jgi:hypothetical protein
MRRDPSKAAFEAILNQRLAMTGERKAANGSTIYPTVPLYKRVNLASGNNPMPGERTKLDVKIGAIQSVLLMLLVACLAAVVGLAR